MTQKVQLTEEMRRLMGIDRQAHGGLPVLFSKSGPIVEGGKRKRARQPFHAIKAVAQPLDEARGLRLFPNEAKMQEGLDRAYKILSRVAATVQHERSSIAPGMMQEKTRAEQYRRDQELVMGMEAITASRDAISNLVVARKEAKRLAQEQRRQGRR